MGHHAASREQHGVALNCEFKGRPTVYVYANENHNISSTFTLNISMAQKRARMSCEQNSKLSLMMQ